MTDDEQQNLVNLIKGALQPEFDKIDKRFESIDKKLKEHDDRFDLMMQLLGEVDEKVDRNYAEMNIKFDNVYNVLDSQNKAIERLETEFTMFTQHVDALEAAVRVLARHQNLTVQLHGE